MDQPPTREQMQDVGRRWKVLRPIIDDYNRLPASGVNEYGPFARRFGLPWLGAAASLCSALHVATFLTQVPTWWLLPAFAVVFVGGVCFRPAPSRRMFTLLANRSGPVSFALFAYAVVLCIYVYRTTGGATSVGIADGHYVYKYKSEIIRVISEGEYAAFPNLAVRAMSAILAAGAITCVIQFGPSLAGEATES